MNELGASNMYEVYSRNASCALRISTFVLLSLDRSNRRYHPPCSQCFALALFIRYIFH